MVRHYIPTGRPTGRPRKGAEVPPAGNTPRKVSPKKPPPHIISDAQILKAMAGLSPQHALAVAALLQGKSKSEAAREAGMHPSTLSPSREAGKIVLSAVARTLNRAGVTPDKLAQRLNESLDAQETKFFPTLAGQSIYDETTKRFVIPHENVIAHGVRLDAVREGFKLHDAYPKETRDGAAPTDGPVVAIQINVAQPGNGSRPAATLGATAELTLTVRQPGNAGSGHNGDAT